MPVMTYIYGTGPGAVLIVLFIFEPGYRANAFFIGSWYITILRIL